MRIIDEKKKMLLIAPHQDDEMLLGGSTLYQFSHSKEWESFVLYTTEGAAVHESPLVRMREAIRALKVMGVPQHNIIFLGYGNGWQNECHIYHAPDDMELTSLKGGKETFALPEHKEYCYLKEGIHHKYTRSYFLHDFKQAILDIKPDVIIAVDMDTHPEHMATSLFLDECLEKILKNIRGYNPLLLKKFAYDGLWHGVDDYFQIPRVPTLNGLNQGNETRNPSLPWDERIRFANPKQCETLFLHNNPLNRAIKKHKSQDGWLCAVRLINSDNIYWVKRTDNLVLLADVYVSSGCAKYLNDFKMVDTLNVRSKNTVWDNCTWYPESKDSLKKITIQWNTVQKIREIVIYESPDIQSGIVKNMRIHMDDGHEFTTGELKHKGAPNRYILKQAHNCSKIILYLEEIEGKSGLSEIEVFSNTFDIHQYLLPAQALEDATVKERYLLMRKTINFFEKKFFHLKARILL